MEGRLDEKNRPVLTLSVNERPVSCLIDTGFNGFLWIDDRTAHRLGLYQHGQIYRSELADGRPAEFKIAIGKILWFDELKNIPIHVFQGERHSDFGALLGTRLLIGNVVLLDYNWGVISIRLPVASDRPSRPRD